MKAFKRWMYLIHRWTGIAGCLLMALWFVSGVVMLYVGLPKLTPWERLGRLPALSADCCTEAAVLPGLTLTSIGGQPSWLRLEGQRLLVFSATDNKPVAVITPERALAEAQQFAPKAKRHYSGLIEEDRWTHSRALDAHRPLHLIELKGEHPGSLYISSTTGQVVLDAPLAQQRWSYVGAWLHWLYFFRNQPQDTVWTWLVIVLSAACTVTAISGIVVGLWRFRFRRRYNNGSRTPYREFWLRWHHLLGLAFSLFVLTWIFSGLMSMNPIDALLPRYPPPNIEDYQGSMQNVPTLLKQPAAIIRTLQQAGFAPVELSWQRLNGESYVLALDNQAQTRLLRADSSGALQVSQYWPDKILLAAAQHLLTAPITQSQVLTDYDAYYYQRHSEAMMGAEQHRLPALQVDFADNGQTRVYLDMQTGEVVQSLDRVQRLRRWWFFFLHSWDTPALLQIGWLRDFVLIALSLGGFAVSLSGVVIGGRRLLGSR